MSIAPLFSAIALSYSVNNTVQCSDSGSGTSPPFCTIGASATKAKAGDTVTVVAGTYSEKVRPSNSGSAGAPISFSASPSSNVTVQGQANGFDLSGRSYITVQGFKISGTTSNGFQLLTSSNITLTGNTVSGAGNNGIYVRESSNVAVGQIDGSGNSVAGSVGHGIYVTSCTNVTVDNNTVTTSGQPTSGLTKKGIYVSGSTGVTVRKNTIANNSNSGISIARSTIWALVKNNTTHDNATAGIEVNGTGTTQNVVDGNITYHNEDSGIQIYSGTNDNLVVNNLTYNNGDHGIDNYNASNMQIIGNSVYGNVTAGINLEGDTSTASSGAKVVNNISVENGINSPRTKGNIRIDNASLPGSSVDYDLVFLSVPGTMFQWGSSFPQSLAESQQSNPTLEVHGIQADPLWNMQPARGSSNPPGQGANFHLRSASTAIDTANSAVSNDLGYDLGHDLESFTRGSAYDRGSYEFH